MKKMKLMVVLLAIVCVFAFAGCGSFDPVAYVEGTLQANMHGNITDEYVDMLSDAESTEELMEEYNETLEDYTDLIIASMGIIDPSETLKQDTMDMFTTIYSATKFEVSDEYTEGENGEYTVEVTLYPLLTFNEVVNDEDGSLTAAVEAAYTPDMSYEDLIMLSLELMIEEINAAMANPTYGEPVVMEVVLTPDEEGYYVFDEDLLEEIDYILLGN